jgi:hypothetical protein
MAAAVKYAKQHSNAEWSPTFINLLESNPFTVKEDRLFALFASLRTDFCSALPPPPPPPSEGPLLYVVWFCRGLPAMLDIVRAVKQHLRDEFTWQQYADIMCRVVTPS